MLCAERRARGVAARYADAGLLRGKARAAAPADALAPRPPLAPSAPLVRGHCCEDTGFSEQGMVGYRARANPRSLFCRKHCEHASAANVMICAGQACCPARRGAGARVSGTGVRAGQLMTLWPHGRRGSCRLSARQRPGVWTACRGCRGAARAARRTRQAPPTRWSVGAVLRAGRRRGGGRGGRAAALLRAGRRRVLAGAALSVVTQAAPACLAAQPRSGCADSVQRVRSCSTPGGGAGGYLDGWYWFSGACCNGALIALLLGQRRRVWPAPGGRVRGVWARRKGPRPRRRARRRRRRGSGEPQARQAGCAGVCSARVLQRRALRGLCRACGAPATARPRSVRPPQSVRCWRADKWRGVQTLASLRTQRLTTPLLHPRRVRAHQH